VNSVSVWLRCPCLCPCVHAHVCETEPEGAPGRGGAGTLQGGLRAGRAPNQAVDLTWAVAPSPCVPGHPQCPLVMEKTVPGCVLLSCPSRLSLKHRAFKPCLSFPSQSHGARATALLCTPQAAPWHRPWEDRCHFFPLQSVPCAARAGGETSVSFPFPLLLLIFCLPSLPWR